MSSTATILDSKVSPADRLEVLFDELAELCGQRNAIDGRIVDIVAEIDRDELAGITGAKSMKALVAWKTGATPRNAEIMVAVARRVDEFPHCVQALRDGQLSVDQVGVLAEHAGDGSDDHYAQLAPVATVTQLRKAVKLEPRTEPKPKPEPQRSFKKTEDKDSTTYVIRLPRIEAAKFDAAMQSHHDALIAEWKRDHHADDEQAPPFPTTVDAFMGLVESGWDTEVTRRPHGQHTTVVVHVDVAKRVGSLHLGPLLTREERRSLGCDATYEVWFERDGQVIGTGRHTRQISRRLRRALEHRDTCCVVPGCGATRGPHVHHIQHWEDGGVTELWKLKCR